MSTAALAPANMIVGQHQRVRAVAARRGCCPADADELVVLAALSYTGHVTAQIPDLAVDTGKPSIGGAQSGATLDRLAKDGIIA